MSGPKPGTRLSRAFKNLITARLALASGSPPQGTIKKICRRTGLTGSGQPDSLRTIIGQFADHQRKKFSPDALPTVSMVHRKQDYLSGGGVAQAVAHLSRGIDAFPTAHAVDFGRHG
jgi:hypothetical protein